MKRKFLSLILVVSMVAGLIPMAISAQTQSGNGWRFDSATGTLTITHDAGGSDWRIMNGNDVRADAVQVLIIENGVRSIGPAAYEDCINLREVTIPDSVLRIWPQAFSGCTSLGEITIPSSVTNIGDSAFRGCTSLATVTIGNGFGFTRIGDLVFEGCTSLTTLTLGKAVISIGHWAFVDCPIENLTVDMEKTPYYNEGGVGPALKNLTFGSNVKTIGYYGDATNLTSVTIPDGVTRLETSFAGCENLSEIIIPDSVTSIGLWTFDRTAWLDNQPDGVVYAGKVAYTYKGNMPENASVTLADGTVGIAERAFDGHRNLTDITIPDSVTHIGKYALGEGFRGTVWMENQPDGIVYAGKVAYVIKGDVQITSVTFAEGTVAIEDGLFYGQQALAHVTIPDSVTRIGANAFEFCIGLTEITIPGSVASIGEQAFWQCENLASVTLGNGIKEIGWGAFYQASITSVVIPDSVTSLGNGAFGNCENLSSVTIGSGITILSGAFGNCENLTEITIPAGVIVIREGAFAGTLITSITLESRIPPMIDSHLGLGPSTTYAVTIYVPRGTRAVYAAHHQWGSHINIIEVGLTLPTDPCDDCDLCVLVAANGGVAPKGRILGEEEPSIFDVLEILKSLVGMDGSIAKCGNALNAALITAESQASGTPTIFDVLEVLKYLVGMDSLVS